MKNTCIHFSANTYSSPTMCQTLLNDHIFKQTNFSVYSTLEMTEICFQFLKLDSQPKTMHEEL